MSEPGVALEALGRPPISMRASRFGLRGCPHCELRGRTCPACERVLVHADCCHADPGCGDDDSLPMAERCEAWLPIRTKREYGGVRCWYRCEQGHHWWMGFSG